MIIGQMDFSSDIKTVLSKFHFVIIGEGQTFMRHHQNCLLFDKIILHDNGVSSNVPMTSLNMGHFCKYLSAIIEAVQIFR